MAGDSRTYANTETMAARVDAAASGTADRNLPFAGGEKGPELWCDAHPCLDDAQKGCTMSIRWLGLHGQQPL